ncbi:MAG: STAS domain-containing protein [Actinomycetota bacterium]
MLTITSTSDPRGLRLSGDIDASNVDQLETALAPEVQEDGDITLDVSELGFIGSAGIQVLVRTLINLEGRGRLIVVGAGATLKKLVGIMGLDGFPHLELR